MGHGESAAHAACADAALGDERLWDGIAGAVGDDGPGSPSGRASPSAARPGCALVGALLLAASSATWRIRH